MSRAIGADQQKEKAAKIRRKSDQASTLPPTFATAHQTNSLNQPDPLQAETRLLQRQCSCGKHTIAGSICEECQQKQNTNTFEISDELSSSRSLNLQTFREHRPHFDFSAVPAHTRSISSRHVIQSSLTVNAPGDQYEQEADKVADAVMRMPAQPLSDSDAFLHPPVSRLPAISRIQASGVADGFEAPIHIEANINRMQGSGQPLPKAERNFFEQRMGYNFSSVRVHTDANAVQTSQDIQAKAFTVGNNIAFNAAAYQPGTDTGRRLLAHELTHVVQQSGERLGLQRKNSCPSSRPPGEKEQSETSAGILANDVVYNASDNKLYIYDFPVDKDQLPSQTMTSPGWQRVMSLIKGTPALGFVGIFGYSDCLGSEKRNSSLRDNRAKVVRDAMPPAAQVKVLMTMGDFTTNFITTNDTAENRAKNRAVVIKMVETTGPKGKELCDTLAVASDLDQYMFLVRCLEKRLGLTSAADAPKTLSVLRQIYYGNAGWTSPGNQNPIWDDVITQQPWSPGNDPGPKLGKTLFKALQKSQKVYNDGQELDIGHLLTGLDAMRKPDSVTASIGPIALETGVDNHAWATWAGDVGSAAAYYTFCVSFLNFSSAHDKYFKNFAGDSDLEGNIDSYANWAALNDKKPTPNLQLDQALSEVLMQYYRITNSKAGQARANRFEIFVNFYGGDVKSRKITKRSQLETNLLGQVSEFALLFLGQKVLKTYQGTPPTGCIGSPPPASSIGRTVSLGSLMGDLFFASDRMTKLFVDWLEKRI